MNIFRKPRRPPPGDETPRERDWAGEPAAPEPPRPFVDEDFDDEFEGEGWRFWGD